MRGLLLLAFAGALLAQDFRATLNGTVFDPSGAVVPKVQVEVRNIDTGEVRKAVTQPNGQFSVPLLPPATYTASAEAPGFKKLRENIILRAGQHRLVPGRIGVRGHHLPGCCAAGRFPTHAVVAEMGGGQAAG